VHALESFPLPLDYHAPAPTVVTTREPLPTAAITIPAAPPGATSLATYLASKTKRKLTSESASEPAPEPTSPTQEDMKLAYVSSVVKPPATYPVAAPGETIDIEEGIAKLDDQPAPLAPDAAASAASAAPSDSTSPEDDVYASPEDEAVAFLEWLRPGGPWVQTAIIPDGPTLTITAKNADEVRAFVTKHDGKRNSYYSVNPTRVAMSKKAAKTDIAAIEFALADCDPNDDETPDQAKARYLSAIKTSGVPQPSAIIFSGNGVQMLWRFAEAILLPDPVGKVLSGEAKAIIDDVEARIASVMIRLGTKAGTQNIDRILRLPGTTNLPNKTKLAKGRVACQAHIIDLNDGVHSLESFPLPKADEPATTRPASHDATTKSDANVDSVDDLTISDRMKTIIRTGEDPEKKHKSRSESVFAVLMALLREGYSDDVCRRFVFDEAYPISAHIFEQNNPETYFDRQIERARKRIETINPQVDLYETYALVQMGAKCAVLNMTSPKLDLMGVEAFVEWNADQFTKGKDGNPTPATKVWRTSKRKKKFKGIMFAPGRDTPGYWNLWRGFPVKPAAPGEGSWEKFREHLLNNVARGDVKNFEWILGFFAQIFQHPGNKLDVALALRGKEGVGKTKVGEIFGHLLGDYYKLVDDPKQVVRQFNKHLATLLLLQSDEAFFAGDHAVRGKLNNLVSGAKIQIEPKFVDAFEVDNFLRIIVTGNPDWIIPAELGARRWAAFDVSDAHEKEHAYFAAIDAEMANGGYEALMRDLLAFDLTTVDLRVVPKTPELLRQKIASLSDKESWLLDFLREGKLQCNLDYGDGCIPTETLYNEYVRTTEKAGGRHRGGQTEFGIFLNKHIPNLERKRAKTGDSRPWCYQFPSLAECRKAFDKSAGQPIGWDDPKAEWEHCAPKTWVRSSDDEGDKPF